MSGEYKSVRLERSEAVVEVVLIGPGKGNAMGPDFWREMPELSPRLIAMKKCAQSSFAETATISATVATCQP